MNTKNQKIIVLKQQAEIEMDLKNSLYGFILDMGFFLELREFELTHDTTKADCPELAPVDPLVEARKEYEIEKNIKCNLYSFIVKHGLYREFLKSDIKLPEIDKCRLSTAAVARSSFRNCSKN